MRNPRRPKKRVEVPVSPGPTNPANPSARFEEVTSFPVSASAFYGTSARTLKYWRFIPADSALAAVGWNGQPYKTITIWPGSAEKGTENTKQMRGGGGSGDAGSLAQKLGWGTANNGTPLSTFPWLVIFPQLPADIADSTTERRFNYHATNEVLAHTESAYACDTTRRGVTGYSYGPIAMWAHAYQHPTTWAWFLSAAGCPADAALAAIPGVTVNTTGDQVTAASQMCATRLSSLPVKYYVSSADGNVGSALWTPLVTAMNAITPGWGTANRIDTGTDHGGVWNAAYTALTTPGHATRTWALAQQRS